MEELLEYQYKLKGKDRWSIGPKSLIVVIVGLVTLNKNQLLSLIKEDKQNMILYQHIIQTKNLLK